MLRVRLNLSQRVSPQLFNKTRILTLCSECPRAVGRTRTRHGWTPSKIVFDTKFIIGFDLAITVSSSPAPSCNLFDIVRGQLAEMQVLKQQTELKLPMLNKRRRWFHSLRVKFIIVSMSASWCLVLMYLVWIFGSRLIMSNNQSNATLCVWDTCHIVGLLSLMAILIVNFKNKAWRA